MKERMEDELWIKKIKDRLKECSEPLPPSGWERLEKDLPVRCTSAARGLRSTPFRRWAVSAAAVLLVAVSTVCLWLTQSRMGDEVRRTNVPALAVIPDNLPKQATPSSTQTDKGEPLYQVHGRNSLNTVSRHSMVAQQIELSTVHEQKVDKTIAEQVKPDNVETQQVKPDSTKTQQVKRRRPSGKDKLHLPIAQKSTSKSRGWSMGLSVGNTGGLENLLGANADRNLTYYDATQVGARLDLSSTANGIVSIPNDQMLIFKDGIPYLMTREKTITSIDHKQPISFGFSVRKNLSKGFSVETGLTYTYLASDVEFDGSSEKLSQKLHYLGIPVRANWNFINNKNFTMYVSAGGAVEKCIYGKVGSENKTVDPIQLSVMGAVGAQYNVSNHVGVYVEPGVSYFFNDGSPIQTIRKENPCNFTLQAGIRLTY